MRLLQGLTETFFLRKKMIHANSPTVPDLGATDFLKGESNGQLRTSLITGNLNACEYNQTHPFPNQAADKFSQKQSNCQGENVFPWLVLRRGSGYVSGSVLAWPGSDPGFQGGNRTATGKNIFLGKLWNGILAQSKGDGASSRRASNGQRKKSISWGGGESKGVGKSGAVTSQMLSFLNQAVTENLMDKIERPVENSFSWGGRKWWMEERKGGEFTSQRQSFLKQAVTENLMEKIELPQENPFSWGGKKWWMKERKGKMVWILRYKTGEKGFGYRESNGQWKKTFPGGKVKE